MGEKKLKHKHNTIGCGKIPELSVQLTRLGAWFVLRKMGCSSSEHYRPTFLLRMRILFLLEYVWSSTNTCFGRVLLLFVVWLLFWSAALIQESQSKRVEPNVLLLPFLVFWSLATCSMAWPVGPVSLHSAPATPPTVLPLYSVLSFSRAAPVRGGQICGKGSVSKTSTSGLR